MLDERYGPHGANQVDDDVVGADRSQRGLPMVYYSLKVNIVCECFMLSTK